ncbi:MAG: Holliday junction resolvase RuvX [bacterium]|jgi:putative holliday junction resolvase
MDSTFKTYLALDVGDKRIGIAKANSISRLPQPFLTINVDNGIMDTINQIIKDEQINVLVLGLPRGMDGQETEQSRKTRKFYDEIKKKINIDVYLIDEAGTSLKAKAELEARGKTYQKSDIDSLAATYILEDYLNEI